MPQRSRSRFAAMVELLPTTDVVADVGAGDLDLARLLLACGRAGRVIAIERAAGAHARAARRAAADGRIELRLGDGLEPVQPREAGAAVIAGLGGRAIARVLRRAAEPGRGYVPPVVLAAPNADEMAALSALAAAGLTLVADRLVAEGARIRPIFLAMRRPSAEGRPDGRGEVLAPDARECANDADALRAAYAAERVTAWRRALAGSEGERAQALREAIARLEARL